MGSVPCLGDKSGRRVTLLQLLEPFTTCRDLGTQEENYLAGECWSTLLGLCRLLEKLRDLALQVDQPPELAYQVGGPAHVDTLFRFSFGLDRDVRLVPRHQSTSRIRYHSLP